MNVNIEKRAGRRHFVEAGVVRAKLIRIVDQFQFSFNFFIVSLYLVGKSELVFLGSWKSQTIFMPDNTSMKKNTN